MYDFKTICRTCICSENLEPININPREKFLDMVFDTTGVEVSYTKTFLALDMTFGLLGPPRKL